MSEDDTQGKKEEMKKSIFMKRKSNENLSVSPRSLEDSKKKSPEMNKKKSSHSSEENKKKSSGSGGSVSPRTNDDKKSPERKNFTNPFSFTQAKKATNEILKNEILKRKTEELNQKKKSSLLVGRSHFHPLSETHDHYCFRTSGAGLCSPAPPRRAAATAPAPAERSPTMKYTRSHLHFLHITLGPF